MGVDVLEDAGHSKKTAIAKKDNMLARDLMKKVWGQTSLCLHTESCAKNHDGRRAVLAMQMNQLGANTIENHHSKV